MKINGNEIKPGNVLLHNGDLYVAVKVSHVKPGKGGAFAQVEMKGIVNGTKLNERFRSSETVERVRLEQKDYQYLYEQGDMLVFMDNESYEQIELPKAVHRGRREDHRRHQRSHLRSPRVRQLIDLIHASITPCYRHDQRCPQGSARCFARLWRGGEPAGVAEGTGGLRHPC